MNRFDCSSGSVINYCIEGAGKPLVFIHGWGVDMHLWLNKIEAISGNWKDRYKRIYFDLPGMGNSIGAKTITNSDDELKDAEEFISFAVADSQYLLAGESYGGYLAGGLLSRYKDRIDGLFQLCPLVYPGFRKGRVAAKVVLEKDAEFLKTLSPRGRAEFGYLSVIQTEEMWKQYKNDIRLEIAEGNEGFLDHQLTGGFVHTSDISSVVYDKPVLVLLARQDTEVGYEDQYELYKGFSRASILILDKSGHNLQIERSGLFNASFLDWIERVETYTDMRSL